MPRVVCIAPAWNEGARIGKVVRAVPPGVVDEIVVVDDGSSDDTAEHAQAAGATVIRQGVNRGVGAAIRAGYDYAREHGYEIAVVISGGGKTPPAQIPRLLASLAAGADFAQGSRYVAGGEQLRLPWHRRVGTLAYSALFSALVRRWTSDASSGFRALRMTVLDDPRIALHQEWLDRYELEPYLLFQALRLGYRVEEVPVTIEYPVADGMPYTKMKAVKDWWRIFRPAVFLAFGVRR